MRPRAIRTYLRLGRKAARVPIPKAAPILVENNGWALFITTPLGNNHAKSMYTMARNDPAWFAEISTVADTQAISLEAVEAQRKDITRYSVKPQAMR
jgi:hypothetical protein